MSQPNVSMTERDGATGVLPPSSGALHAIIGVSSKGALNTPATFASVPALVAAFGGGPLVEAAAHYIELYSRQVVVVRTGQTTAGSATAVDDDDVAGTSVVTRDVAVVPVDDLEVVVRIVTGGTLGVTGITLQWSIDGGSSWSPVTALGTAMSFTLPAPTPAGSPAPGVKFDFAAGTLIAGDTFSTRTSAPQWDGTEIGEALEALRLTAAVWRDAHVVGPIDATLFDAIEAKFVSMSSAHDPHGWTGNVRIPTIGETEADYLASVSAAFAAKVTVLGALCAGACDLTSSVSGRKQLRPISFAVAAREAASDEQVNNAAIRRGALRNVSIRDVNGNPKHHDESANPGLDDARFTVLRTWRRRPGVFINRSRIFSAPTSDFRLFAHRRVMNLARRAVVSYLEERLNEEVRVNPDTGYILESDAKSIEAGARAAMRAVGLGGTKASGYSFALSRTDNLLALPRLNYQTRVVPLGYAEELVGDIAFENPALSVQAVA